ncbi:hypothetical protein TEA_022983 [Camellia sinensis var. sinensis]|uniref:PHD finger protein ALFIN-LIKE n=1 Tax=Camellia sinensis var. sinensis TaxID=542762 RepID=A0A4S4E8Q9_CAMSN|nr:hypothetical protein TEA_022983 [Camellia sinensis var. sinensis]
MVSYVSVLLYGVGGIVVAGMALLVAFQERLVYVPVLPGLTKSYPVTPSRLRLTYEDVWLRSSDGVRLHACYGASDGYPSQHGITKDAQAALDHLAQRTDIDTSRIVVFGRSLGGAVGAVLTKNNPEKVAGLILENTFTSILDMAGVLLPFLKWFIGSSSSNGPKVLNSLVRSPWSTIDVIGQIKQPILFLSGLQDEMVPPPHMQMLYAKAAAHNSRCIFVDFPNGMHMDTWLSGGDRYWRTVQLFLEQNVPENKDDLSSHKDSYVEEFYQQCDPVDVIPMLIVYKQLIFLAEKENLCLYGFPSEQWEVNLPAEEVPPELPEPALGINFARDGMQEKDWLALVAVHSDAWLLSVAFYFGARFGFDKADRKRLFNMINDLPTIFEVVTGTPKKPAKDKSAVSNHSSNKTKSNTKGRGSESQAKFSKPKDEEEGLLDEEEEDEHGDTLCGACGDNYASDEFWICCDMCERWFHGKCVKITPARAEHIKQYKCPTCSNKRARP